MNNYEQNKQEEETYLKKTVNVIKKELGKEEEHLSGRVSNLIASRKEMWEQSVHFSNDYDRIPEMVQHLSEVNSKTKNYESALKRIEKYKRMVRSPYFGRVDFKEDRFDEIEKIYIGLYNLMDAETDTIFVYDWRAPISSIFYQSEIGKDSYNSPVGIISGEVLLKRQYRIENSQLKYFFDSSIRINDEILQEVLSRNSSSKMRNIVETIQREQDIIIRDTESELLIVQGVAGSGKTSIALHRIAFLLYQGLSSKIASSNVIIISPNSTFSKYISDVLPELGEENVEQITFDDIALRTLGKRFKVENRTSLLESLVTNQNNEGSTVKMQSIKFKGSETFTKILDRFIKYYERSLIPFEDVYYDGEIIETKYQLKNLFLNNKIGMPIAKRLKRIENMILNKIHPLRKIRLKKIESIVQKSIGHELEIKSFSRLLSIKETKVFMEHLHSFTEIDYMDLYKMIFSKKELFSRLSEGLELPKNIKKVILETERTLQKGYISYEDCASLLYIKLKLEGNDEFTEIRQVVVDEAQDYYPLQYEVFKLLFKGARYTILGDFNQALEKQVDRGLYDDIEKILNKRKSVKIFMSKSYRSSFEINAFNQRLLNGKQDLISFERHEAEPMIIFKDNQKLIDEAIIKDINDYYKQRYDSIAVICKTQKEAEEIQGRLKNLTDIKILNVNEDEIQKGALVIPSYLAKGLEFDVVIVYDASSENYKSQFDKKLLYIACTRALHQLMIYHTGEKCKFI